MNDIEGVIPPSAAKYGWRVQEWAAAVGVCRATTYKLLAAGELRSAKIGASRVITTSPSDFLASRADDGK